MMFNKQRFFYKVLAFFFLTCSVHAAETPASVVDPENLPTPAPVLVTSTATTVTTAASPGNVNASFSSDSGNTLSAYNHVVFHFNDMLDRAILKPVATLYNKLIPRPLHQGITNVFSNIDNIPTVINDVLQLNLYTTFSDAWRLAINSTVGILGLFDVASRIGLKPHHEDFGLTMARWGYTHSNYIVIPFFGPGTIRDVIGWPIDYFFFSIYPHIPDTTVRYSVYGVGVVDRRSNLLQYQDVMEQIAVDRYGFLRSAYLQHREYQIKANQKSGNPAKDEADKAS